MDRLKSYRDKDEVVIPLLVDADSAVIKSYGILNEKQGSVPHPAVILVDKEGNVSFFHLDEDYTKRPPVDTLLDAVRKIEG